MKLKYGYLSLIIGLIGCNEAPKGRPAAGDKVLPTQKVDPTKTDAENEAARKQAQEDEVKRQNDAESKAKTTQPTSPGAATPFKQIVITSLTSSNPIIDESETGVPCFLAKDAKLTVKTEPKTNPIAPNHVVFEIDPPAGCKLSKISIDKSNWSGWETIKI